ncbi:myrosinase 1-like isoform X2 [Aphidius gifuensis]|nr:myrosinase 1-like isoform X2 [Aphidius gifuensis]
MIQDKSNGDIAADTYHKYKEDIQLMKKAGFNHFRLSLSWARILPTGFADKVSQDGVQYYKNVLDELHANNIEPIVTIYHFDHPDALEKVSGWLNETMVEAFADYARFVFSEFGSRVKVWTTINAPTFLCNYGYGSGTSAPGLQMPGVGPYICVHNMLKAHARAYRIYDEEFRKTQHGQVGVVVSCGHFFPINKNDTESPDIAYQYECGWFAHPVFSNKGDYPSIMRKRIDENSKLQGYPKSRLPVFSSEWIKYIRGTYDYLGLNHYSSNMVDSVEKDEQTGWYDDSGIIQSVNDSWPSIGSGMKTVPHGFSGLLRKIKEEYNNPIVYVMENGVADYGHKLNIIDFERVNFYYSYMKEMILAITRDGCNVKKYTIWSFLDSFEWGRGYTERYGIVYVNFTDPNRSRTPRQSYYWLKYINNKRNLLSLEEFNNQ